MNPSARSYAWHTLAVLALILFAFCAPSAGASTLSGADIASLNGQMIDAAAKGDMDTVSVDVYRGADVNAVDQYRRTPLTACAGGSGDESTRLKIIKMLVGMGADVNQHSVFLPTSLLIAIDNQQKLIVEYLLDNGADSGTFDSLGECALTHAARSGQLDVVHELIAHGADVNFTDHRGRTPLMWASGQPASIQDYASLNEVVASETGYTVLHCVHSRVGDLPGGGLIVHALLAAKADINAVDSDGNTALMIAAAAGKTEVVRALIDSGADWHRRNNSSYTALICAQSNGFEETAAYLKSIGGTRDPIYVNLQKRIEADRSAREKDIEKSYVRQAEGPRSDVAGLTLRVYSDSEFIGQDKVPVIHFVLENRTSAPIKLISALDSHSDRPSAAKAAWSLAAVDGKRGMHPPEPAFPMSAPSGGTVSAIASISVVTVPAHGQVAMPVSAELSQMTGWPQAVSGPGIYRAAFYFICDPQNLPYSTDQVHAIANTTMPCRLISNEITIIND